MIRFRSILAATAILAVVGAVYWPESFTADTDVAVTLPALRWPTYQRAVYDISIESRDEIVPVIGVGSDRSAGTPIRSALSLAATLSITDRGSAPESDDQLVEFAIVSCEGATFSIGDQEAWADADACDATMSDASLVASISARGRVNKLYDDPAADATAAAVLQYIVMSLQLELSSIPQKRTGTWRATEPGLSGTTLATYRLDSFGRENFQITRTLTGLKDLVLAHGLSEEPTTSIEGQHGITVNRAGLLTALAGHSDSSATLPGQGKILASNSALQLKFLRLDSAQPPRRRIAQLVPRSPSAARESSVADEQILDHRIAGLTHKQMLDNFAAYGNDGKFPDHARFLWRVTGFLTKHPEHARDLLALYRRPAASRRMRALVLDVLAGTGNAEAQRVMVEAVAHHVSMGSKERRRLYQRLGFIEAPTLATAAAVADDYSSVRGTTGPDSADNRLTTAYSLGAIAGKLGDEGTAQAAMYRGWIAEDMLAAENDAELAHYITALSVAGGDDLVELIGPMADHANNEVRRATAAALGRSPSDEAHSLLQGLVGDSDPVVQRTAMGSARTMLDESMLSSLADTVARGRVTPLNQRTLLNMLNRNMTDNPGAARAVLRAMLDAGINDPKLRQAALALAQQSYAR